MTDIMLTLMVCVAVFSAPNLRPHSRDMWAVICCALMVLLSAGSILWLVLR